MPGFLEELRKRVILSVREETQVEKKTIDDRIALGVLLWVVAEADEKFFPQEAEKIKEILRSHCEIPEEDIPYIMSSIEEAAKQRVDLYRFAHELTKGLDYEAKLSILENLFRVACSDKDLDYKEHEVIRKVSKLFELSHRDFIQAKIKVKREFGLDTA